MKDLADQIERKTLRTRTLQDGTMCTLRTLCEKEPEWAENRILHVEAEVAHWMRHAEMFKEDCENIKQEHSKLIEGLIVWLDGETRTRSKNGMRSDEDVGHNRALLSVIAYLKHINKEMQCLIP